MSLSPAPVAGLRPPAPGELAGLAANENRCHTNPWNRRLLLDSLAARHSLVLLAIRAGRPVGHVVARRVADEGEILNLCVAPAHRRRGWARHLLEETLARLERDGAAQVFLEVRASNEAAVALYRSLGFHRQQRRRDYYPPTEPGAQREDAWVMACALPRCAPHPSPCPGSAPNPPSPDRSP